MVKNLHANAGGVGLVPGSGRSPGEGNGNPPQYSCLENPMDRGAWQATVHGVAELDTTYTTSKRLLSKGSSNPKAWILFYRNKQTCFSLAKMC